MTTNQYLPFGTAGGANVLSPADYAALAARLTGFVAGVAQSEELNTVWRQASVIAAMIGQFVGDIGGYDALDDGNVANLLLSFERAIQSQQMNYVAAGGTANALTASLLPAPSAYKNGLTIDVLFASTNTGAMTINVNGLGVVNIVRPNGSPTIPGDAVGGTIGTLTYNSGSFQITSQIQTPLNAYSIFTSNGSFTVPAGVTRLKRVRVWGGGGGGGGATASTVISAGSGGGGGGYSEGSFSVTPGQVLAITVGTGGAAGTATGFGGTGGTTSVGALISATGGIGGNPGVDGVPGVAGTGGSGSGGGLNLTGGGGGFGITISPTALGGTGGSAPFGGCSPSPNSGANGSIGIFPGGAGNGGSTPVTGARLGGAGAAGLVIIEY